MSNLSNTARAKLLSARAKNRKAALALGDAGVASILELAEERQQVVIEECRIDSIVRDGIWIRGTWKKPVGSSRYPRNTKIEMPFRPDFILPAAESRFSIRTRTCRIRSRTPC